MVINSLLYEKKIRSNGIIRSMFIDYFQYDIIIMYTYKV